MIAGFIVTKRLLYLSDMQSSSSLLLKKGIIVRNTPAGDIELGAARVGLHTAQ
jgi:hypothetical protein